MQEHDWVDVLRLKKNLRASLVLGKNLRFFFLSMIALDVVMFLIYAGDGDMLMALLYLGFTAIMLKSYKSTKDTDNRTARALRELDEVVP